jgi:hypothetical protein
MTSDDAAAYRPSRRFAAISFSCLVIVFLLAYSRSFLVKPASDDWPIVTEMQRGNAQGVGVFFTDSVIRIGYRPLKSLLIWAACNLGGDDIDARCAWVRVVHLLFAVGYAAVALLWIRQMPVGRAGTIVAVAIMLLHPVMPQAVGSMDGLDTLASSALLWLGAWCVLRFRDNLIAAVATSCACFVVGVGFKENLFALVPLSLLVVIVLYPRERQAACGFAIGCALALAAAAAIIVRFYVITGGLGAGSQMLDFSARQLLKNVALFATGLLFFGDSVWVFVNESKLVLATVGAWCLTIFAIIVTGLIRHPAHRWTSFFLLGLVIAAFPTVLLYHVSEMYVPPMVLPFALLCVLSAEGWRQAARPARFAVGAVAGAALALSVITIRNKISGLVEVGDRADRQLRRVLDHVSASARDVRILLLFDEQQLPPKRTYAVFRMGDEILLVHEQTPRWLRPGDGITLQSAVTRDPLWHDATGYNLVLIWDATTQRFTPRAASAPPPLRDGS